MTPVEYRKVHFENAALAEGRGGPAALQTSRTQE